MGGDRIHWRLNLPALFLAEADQILDIRPATPAAGAYPEFFAQGVYRGASALNGGYNTGFFHSEAEADKLGHRL